MAQAWSPSTWKKRGQEGRTFKDGLTERERKKEEEEEEEEEQQQQLRAGEMLRWAMGACWF